MSKYQFSYLKVCRLNIALKKIKYYFHPVMFNKPLSNYW